MSRHYRYLALIAWFGALLLATFIVANARYATDLSAFLPRSPTPAQQLLVDQLRDGVVSRLILVGISSAPPDDLAKLSTALSQSLRQNNAGEHSQFIAIHNGTPEPLDADQKFVFDYRYLLSDAVDEEFFSASSLRAHFEEALARLASPAGLLAKELLRADPTGEVMRLVDRFAGTARPNTHGGVWMSADKLTALAVLQTRAAGFDIDAQERAVNSIRDAFALAKQTSGVSAAQLDLAGPGVYSVSTRATIKGDAIRFSTIATILVTLLLLITFRSLRVLALGLLPLISGALCGIAAVAVGFGEVHGITLGFGATLIGEAVDYAIYLFMQTDQTQGAQHTLTRIWPTLRLGVLTSVVGFSAMLLSGFPGLSQLGLFSMVGLIVAVSVTRFILPTLMPAEFEVAKRVGLSRAIARAFRAATRLRWLIAATSIMGMALLWRTEPLWSDQLSSLSPVPLADQQTDERLRRELGAADVRHLIVVRGASMDEVLEHAERLKAPLDSVVARQALTGYDTPARYLPSTRTQRLRQQSIPARAKINSSLAEALTDMPFRPNTFARFVDDVERTKRMQLIDRSALNGTQLALKFDSLVLRRGEAWFAMVPLSGVTDITAIGRALDAASIPEAILLDTKTESDRLYSGYRREAAWLSLAGGAAIVMLLLISMRSLKRLVAVCVPLAAAVVVTLSALVLLSHTLTIFHLVGVLLVAAVGSNYALFFDRGAIAHEDQERTSLSLALANLTTVLGFGLLAFSSVPVLAAIGSTVGIGAFLSLIFAAALAPRVKESKA